jgi:4-hydroxybenzoate polyprenyltransferase
MMNLFGSLSNASAKIMATFFMVLVLMMLGVMFMPSAFNGVNDFANHIANLDMIRNPNLGEQGVAVFRVFINEASIFGILMTLIARAVVEVIWWGSARLWRLANPAEDKYS